MKKTIAISLVILVLGCSNQSASQNNSPIIRSPVVTTKDRTSEELKFYSSLNQKMKVAPFYGSTIRNILRNPSSQYRFTGSVEMILKNPKRFPEKFQCVHPISIIAKLEMQGWELVHCEGARADFYRPTGQYQKVTEECPKMISYDFDILSIRLRYKSGNEAGRDARFLFDSIRFGSNNRPNELSKLKERMNVQEDQQLLFRSSWVLDGLHLGIINIAKRRGYSLHHKTDDCPRYSGVWQLGDNMDISFFGLNTNHGDLKQKVSQLEASLKSVE